jgi:hypothetical protein
VEVERRRIENRRRHLRRHEPLPDELIQLEVLVLDVSLDIVRLARRIRRTNRFVRVLRIGLLVVPVKLRPRLREIFVAKVALHDFTRGQCGAFRHTRAVRAHVRDEARGALGAEVRALVQRLRDPHRAFGAEAEFLGGFLLQRAGGERRGRILPALATLDLRERERKRGAHLRGVRRGPSQALDIRDDGACLCLVVDLHLAIIDAVQARRELLAVVLHRRGDRPVFLRLERADVPLALDEEPERDRLNATSRQAFLDRLPEDRTRLVADQAVEHTTRLLRVDQARVDIARMLHGLAHGVLRDLVEQDAPDAGTGLPLDLLGHVPSDRLALAIRVGRDIDGIRVMRRFLDLGQRLFLARYRDVFGLEALLDVDAQLFLGQVTDVADGRLHAIAAAQVLADRLRLVRRLHDHERATATGAVAGFLRLFGNATTGRLGGRLRLRSRRQCLFLLRSRRRARRSPPSGYAPNGWLGRVISGLFLCSHLSSVLKPRA